MQISCQFLYCELHNRMKPFIYCCSLLKYCSKINLSGFSSSLPAKKARGQGWRTDLVWSGFTVPLSTLQMQDKKIEVKNSNRSRFLLRPELQSDPTSLFLVVTVQDAKPYSSFGNCFPLLYLISLFNYNSNNADIAVSLENPCDDRFPKFTTCCLN